MERKVDVAKKEGMRPERGSEAKKEEAKEEPVHKMQKEN